MLRKFEDPGLDPVPAMLEAPAGELVLAAVS
jgi:hypothetical protein